MVSKYLNTIVKTVVVGIANIDKGTCVFNGVYSKPSLGNQRDCSKIECYQCPFSKLNLKNIKEVLNHE